jgi:hypothetical protein
MKVISVEKKEDRILESGTMIKIFGQEYEKTFFLP